MKAWETGTHRREYGGTAREGYIPLFLSQQQMIGTNHAVRRTSKTNFETRHRLKKRAYVGVHFKSIPATLIAPIYRVNRALP